MIAKRKDPRKYSGSFRPWLPFCIAANLDTAGDCDEQLLFIEALENSTDMVMLSINKPFNSFDTSLKAVADHHYTLISSKRNMKLCLFCLNPSLVSS